MKVTCFIIFDGFMISEEFLALLDMENYSLFYEDCTVCRLLKHGYTLG